MVKIVLESETIIEYNIENNFLGKQDMSYKVLDSGDAGFDYKTSRSKICQVSGDGSSCNQPLRYWAYVENEDNGETLIVGEKCFENLTGLQSEQRKFFSSLFKGLRKKADYKAKSDELRQKQIQATAEFKAELDLIYGKYKQTSQELSFEEYIDSKGGSIIYQDRLLRRLLALREAETPVMPREIFEALGKKELQDRIDGCWVVLEEMKTVWLNITHKAYAFDVFLNKYGLITLFREEKDSLFNLNKRLEELDNPITEFKL